MSGSPTGSRGGSRVGLFEFLRDVLTAALDKGQFPSALTAIILLAVIWKISASDLGHLLGRLVDFAERRSFVGYWLAIVSPFGWYFRVRHKNRQIARLRAGELIIAAKNEVGRK
jgi:hypothetical protein